MKSALTRVAALLGLLTLGIAQETSRPEVPDAIKAPEDDQLVLVAHATGFQVYTCQVGADGQPAWAFKEPEAELRDKEDRVIGRHYAGPTWKYNDGSEVVGKPVAKVESPDSASIPWLLLTATKHSGAGEMARVSAIQRVHTKGGQPPPAARCTSSNLNAATKSTYIADYYFYASAK